VHIPVLPEQARRKYRDSPFMPIEMARKALSITINHAFEANRRDSQTL
jgi:pyrrolidone-carboxylate peptidase